ncbi:integrin beta pat-3-like [Ostrinia furnacalis]|uniref:integrin beta pat-3-like n=1 Tax=Ostrinia furnacalis TaxID=93504 RepID=UPI00103E1437|nr:integrin beta pat-3-like [Ostrinia furnacalis]
MKVLVAIVFFILYVKPSFCGISCSNFATCGECIAYGGDKCVWCSEPNITTSRCQSEALSKKSWCKKEFLYNPVMYTEKNITSEKFRLGNEKLKSIQLRPQKLHLKIRPGATYNFVMDYKPAKHFPLDVYYLMDSSYTMRDTVKSLKTKAKSVFELLTKFTNNVKFGLGTFIEKPALPFVEPNLHYAYSYRHHLNFTSNMTEFVEAMKEIKTGGNFDDQEAGLDALMQVMACDDELEWRSDAKRIIILCTDAAYHSAGDGKMVGAEIPNDMKCHLNESKFYDHSLIQDYPSVSQINKMSSDGNFIIIFAANKIVEYDYTALAEQITGAKYVELTSDIYEIIKTAYLKSVRHLTIKYQWPPYVQLKLDPDCTVVDERCKMAHEEAVSMKAEIKVTSCPENTTVDLEVGPTVGGLADKLMIKLEIDCQCECERDEKAVQNSSMCSNAGSYQCGICNCNSDRGGNICQCDKTATSTTDLEIDKCKHENGTRFCSGRGSCECGKCKCSVGFSGDFCEFDDNSCKRQDGKLCSDNGRCTHGACECDEDWGGEDCSCFNRNSNCFAPYSKEVCSNNGQCVCDECVCHKIAGKNETYSGAFCEDCEDCAEKRCKELEDYAYCNYLNNQMYCDDKYNQTSNTDVQILNKTEISASKWPTAKWCRKVLENGTALVFLHSYNKNSKKLHIIIQKELEAPPKANIWVPVGIAIGTVILIGLLTVLVWKVLVDIMDEREYERFEAEAKAQGFDVHEENPIFEPASINFANPTYTRGIATK